MNKRQFINELEKRLKVLNENERKDIVNEYSDIINEKIKNGETEEQAVSEFGNIDELVKEILESYKINPNYDDGFSKKAKEVASNTEDFIKKGAQKLADTTKNVVNDFKNSGRTLTLESVFEIIIKVFIFLIILGLLRIPFYILRELGVSVFEGIFSPFDFGFNIIWRIIVWLLYIICCILIGIVFFKKYMNNVKGLSNSNIEDFCVQNKQSTKSKNQDYSNLHKTEAKSKSSSALSIIIKVCAIIFIMIPLCSIIFGLFTATSISLYLLIKGVPVLGIFICLLGLSLGSGWLFDIFNRIIFTKKKIYISIFFVSLIITILGGIIFVSELFDFNFYDKLPNIELDNYTENIHISGDLYIHDMYDHEIIIDDTLSDDEVIVSIDYYSELTYIDKYYNRSDNLVLNLYSDQKSKYYFKKTIDIIMDNLKNHDIYNYEYLYKGNATIKVNSNTKDKIIISN